MIEKQVINAIVEHQKLEIMPNINPIWFADKINLELYKSVVYSFNENKKIDVNSLKTYIHSNGHSTLMKSKMLGRLNDIINSDIFPTSDIVKNFQEYYIQTNLNKYVEHHLNNDSTIDSKQNLLNDVYKKINVNIDMNESSTLEDAINEYVANLIKLDKGEEVFTDKFQENSIKLHNLVLKRIFGNSLRPWPIGIGADPNFHKTSLLINLAVDINYSDIPGLFFSFEDTRDTLRSKFLAVKHNIPIKRVIDHAYTEKEKELFYRQIKKKNLHIIDKRVNLLKFREIVDRHVMLYGIKYILVDYFQCFDVDYRIGEATSYGLFGKEFVNIKHDYNIPVITTSQLTEVDGGEPNLRSWKDCKSISADFRQVIFLYGDRQSNIRTIKIAKNTFAGLDKFDVTFNKDSQKLELPC